MNIALCGNPNVGKTTLFNRITRSDEPVGNWHGVTVQAATKRLGEHILTDLPGAYSLSPRTAEEEITQRAVLFGDYDCFLYVADANALRRNLYMFVQLAEAGKHAALVVNMLDEARTKIDLELLSERLGVPVVGTSVRAPDPRAQLIAAAQRACAASVVTPPYAATSSVARDSALIAPAARAARLQPLYCALKVKERDEYITGLVGRCPGCSGCADRDEPAAMRYKYIDSLLDGVTENAVGAAKRTARADRVLLGALALPILLAVMSAVFVATFELGRPLSEWLCRLVELAAAPVRSANMPAWCALLLADGVISGLGSVLAFLPQVVLLFVFTAILQDSGYMSRVAFVTDDFFKRFGLSGRAAFSIVLGFGCSATAVLSTRGIPGEHAGRRAALAVPFCPCSARLAVFTALAAYFGLSGAVVAAMYVLGVGAALAVLLVAKRFGGRDEDDAFIMEMPPYRLPGARRVARVVWRNVVSFALRVGSVVLGVSVIMWVLCNFSVTEGFVGGPERSIMRTLSGAIAPLFEPLGFGNWRAVTALISGVAAKETVISVLTALGGAQAALPSSAAATSFMIFTCLYIPCVATLSALAKEAGRRCAAISAGLHTAAAYICSLVYYRAAVSQNGITIAIVVASVTVAAAAVIIVSGSIQKRKHGQKV